MKRFIVIVLDGFGIGAMKDAEKTRPGDESSNTLRSILKDFPSLKLANLEKLGLMNSYGEESLNMRYSKRANTGRSELMHWGADTFMGHQEIMGTYPKKPMAEPFSQKAEIIKEHLEGLGRTVRVITQSTLSYLLVDDYVVVSDNIDSDLGMAYNCTAPLDFIDFQQVLKIGQEVRQIATVNRVIPLGGTGVSLKDILRAEEIREKSYIGIVAAKSGVYKKGYQCMHLGYGVDKNVQAPTILTGAGISVSLFGKVADIVANDGGKSISCVDTARVLELTIEEVKAMEKGFICTNVQETDLAGHSQDSTRFKEVLEIADEKIGDIISLLEKDDVLLVMADHGNDPNIGHNKHTRENVPLLLYKKGVEGASLGLRSSLSDVGATVCHYFGVEAPENGKSFLNLVMK